MKENLGILLPIASLPGKHGIGDFGYSCYEFIKWLKKNNYRYWQILPLNPIGPCNSPYMSTCSNAIEERYICLDELYKLGYLELKDIKPYKEKSNRIDYSSVGKHKDKILFKAFQNFKKNQLKGYKKFIKENPWLIKYALFLTFKEENNFVAWNAWPKWMINYFDDHKLVPDKFKNKCEFIYFKQFIANYQYDKVQKFANKNNIKIIADCPFYVGLDSLDCWLHKEEFVMDENYHPTLVGGCPPDIFSDDGQLWGTPIYDFEKMKENNYFFLIERIHYLANKCDLLRLDHFRAFDTYCVIPSEDINARRGKWVNGPGESFFEQLYKKYPNINLVAEDLGNLFPSVISLRDKYNANKNLYDKLFNYVLTLPSYITIFQLQDLIMMDDRGRINSPGTTLEKNWTFRLKDFSWIKKIKFSNN